MKFKYQQYFIIYFSSDIIAVSQSKINDQQERYEYSIKQERVCGYDGSC
jgi:hypothetical protein